MKMTQIVLKRFNFSFFILLNEEHNHVLYSHFSAHLYRQVMPTSVKDVWLTLKVILATTV